MAEPAALTKSKEPPTSLVDPKQTLKASKALLAYIKQATKENAAKSSKKNILDGGDDDSATITETPIWLTLATKRHVQDSRRLQPHKIVLPHPLNSDAEATICLITASPQRAYKNIIASDDFPSELRKRITRVIDLKHLQAKFSQYQQQRQLYSEHDVFLGDDRIINRIPKILGKNFYKTTTKRPIPVVFQNPRQRTDGKKMKREKKEDEINAKPAPEIAAEIENAIGAALVNLSATTNTAIKVGYAGWKPDHLSANIETVAGALVEKFVPQKWNNVKAIFIKGPRTTALPIWQTEELWLHQNDVVVDGSEEAKALEAKKEKANVGKKRRSDDAERKDADTGRLQKRAKKLPEAEEDVAKKQSAERKSKLKKQKKAAAKAMEESE